MIQFRVLSFDDAECIRQWRNEDLSNLRTPYLLTELMQEEWYRKVVSNRDSRARWWSVWDEVYETNSHLVEYHYSDSLSQDSLPQIMVGAGALETIEWENRRAEVSLIITADSRKKGIGDAAVTELLRRAWGELNLDSVWGEVYGCGPVGFWRKVLPPETKWATIPQTKWFGGRYWDSQVFTVLRPVLSSPDAAR